MILVIPSVVLVAAAFVSLYRIITGPSNADRVVAGDVFGVSMSLGLVLISLQMNTPMVLDVVIAYAVLLFAEVLLLAKFIERGEIHR